MHVIGVLGAKGGTGKTTCTACLSVAAAAEGSVAVLDLDPQSSYSDWFSRRCERGVDDPPNPDLLRDADRASDAIEGLRNAAPYDYVFLDGPPGSLMVTEDAISVSDLVLLPLRASGLDLKATRDAFELCSAAGVPLLAVINDVGRQDGKLVERMRGALQALKVTCFEDYIAHRVAYVNAMTTGKVGSEIDTTARGEIDKLWQEIKSRLGARR